MEESSKIEKLYNRMCDELGCVNPGWHNLNPNYQQHFINSFNNLVMVVQLGGYAEND